MTRMGTRHRRQEIVAPLGSASADEQAIHHALKPLDKVARDMEAKWGVDRLPELVTPEMAAKFGGALGRLNAVIDAGNVEAVQTAAANLIRGWQALDAAATQAGHQPPTPDAWPVRIGDDARSPPAWIAKDPAAAHAVNALKGPVAVYTLNEVGRLIALALGSAAPAVGEAKRLFPGATVARIQKHKPPVDWDLGGDEIPF